VPGLAEQQDGGDQVVVPEGVQDVQADVDADGSAVLGSGRRVGVVVQEKLTQAGRQVIVCAC